MPSAPANPPMLYIAWNPDISGRCATRSTSTAWTFIATLIVPSEAPNPKNATASTNKLFATDSTGSSNTRPKPPPRIIGLLPSRAVSHPVSGMATIEPYTEAQKEQAEGAVTDADFPLAKGTSDAQHDMLKLAAGKDRRVASRVFA
jgi:hypothetical protein